MHNEGIHNFKLLPITEAIPEPDLVTSRIPGEDPEQLEALMNNCIRFSSDGDRIEFDFAQFVPNGQDGGHHVVESAMVAYMSQSYKYRHLLRHPLLVVYLSAKWEVMRLLPYFIFAVYLIFALLLHVVILSNLWTSQQPPFHQNWLFLTITIALGLVPAVVGLCVHFNSFDNWIGLVSSVMLLVLFCQKKPNVMVVFSAISLVGLKCFIMLGGIFDKCAVYVDMFKLVLKDVGKCLLLYLVLFYSFGLYFYISLGENQRLENNGTENGTLKFDVWLKPFALLVANDADKNFDKSLAGTMVHLITIVMLPIVLANLLIGLAVGDITSVANRAELSFYCNRAQFIHAVELFHRNLRWLRCLLKPLVRKSRIFQERTSLTGTIVKDVGNDANSRFLTVCRFVRVHLLGDKGIDREVDDGALYLSKSIVPALDELCQKYFQRAGIRRDFIIRKAYLHVREFN